MKKAGVFKPLISFFEISELTLMTYFNGNLQTGMSFIC